MHDFEFHHFGAVPKPKQINTPAIIGQNIKIYQNQLSNVVSLNKKNETPVSGTTIQSLLLWGF